MSVLVTGGTGFVGAEVARLLVEQGNQDVVLFDLYPNEDAVKDIKGGVTVLRGDFAEGVDLLKVLSNHDISDIVHLAYLTGEAEGFPASAIRVNCGGTNNIFETAIASGVRRVVWASSAGVYGATTTSSTPSWLREDEPTRPNNVYGACKLFNEHTAEIYADRFGFDHVGLRLCSVFGGRRGARRGIAPDFYAALIDNAGTSKVTPAPPADHMVTWGYVKDIAAAFYAAFAAESPQHRIYNVPGESTTVRAAVDIVSSLRPGTTVSYSAAPLRHLAYLDGERIKTDLGFSPAYSAEAALRDCLMDGSAPR